MGGCAGSLGKRNKDSIFSNNLGSNVCKFFKKLKRKENIKTGYNCAESDPNDAINCDGSVDFIESVNFVTCRGGNLEMEIELMGELMKVMPTTSSPKSCYRKNSCLLVESEVEEDDVSYFTWKMHLERPKRYMVQDVTRIPEAVAGQFTPKGFPGFTYLNLVEGFKLDQSSEEDRTPRVSAEWSSGWGPEIIVEIEETASDLQKENIKFNSTGLNEGPKLIVRAEEVLIVLFVLLLWVGAIVLFFNRWGKIRMLEPYQPKFQQQHRSSCPLVDLESIPPLHRTSVSRTSMGMAVPIQMPTCQFSSFSSNSGPFPHTRGYATFSRPRQNSVFVGPQVVTPKPPRKTRSAMDLHSMVLDEAPEPV